MSNENNNIDTTNSFINIDQQNTILEQYNYNDQYDFIDQNHVSLSPNPNSHM